MKILYVVPDLNVGGVTTVVLNNIKELQQRGCLIKLVTMKTIVEPKKYNELNFYSLNINSSKDIFKALMEFNKIVRKFKPDIIHSHTYYANMLIRAYSMIYNNKIVKICNEHGTYRKGVNSTHWLLFKITRKVPDSFVNVSHSSLMSYINNGLCDKRNCAVLYNGIALGKFKKDVELIIKLRNKYSLSSEDIVFGYVGRLSKEKDAINLLQAVNFLKERSKKNFKLIIVGDGPERNNLIDFVNTHKLDDIIVFVGEKSDVVPYLSIIDILVLPSKTEGLPTVLLEAMAMECMIVTTDCGGVAEILSGTKSYIAPVGEPYQLASKMNEVLKLDYDTKNFYAKEYRAKIVSDFSIQTTVDKIYELYINLLSKDKL